MLERRKTNGTLDALRNTDGSIHCVFICCDLPYQYIDEYFTKLDEASFPPLHNPVSRRLQRSKWAAFPVILTDYSRTSSKLIFIDMTKLGSSKRQTL